jgi:hypothetical protein
LDHETLELPEPFPIASVEPSPTAEEMALRRTDLVQGDLFDRRLVLERIKADEERD